MNYKVVKDEGPAYIYMMSLDYEREYQLSLSECPFCVKCWSPLLLSASDAHLSVESPGSEHREDCQES